jgi:hypothetical protein
VSGGITRGLSTVRILVVDDFALLVEPLEFESRRPRHSFYKTQAALIGRVLHACCNKHPCKVGHKLGGLWTTQKPTSQTTVH